MRGSLVLCGRAVVREVIFSAARAFPSGISPNLYLPAAFLGNEHPFLSLLFPCQAATVLQAAFRGHRARVKLLSSKVCGSESASVPSLPSQVTFREGKTQPQSSQLPQFLLLGLRRHALPCGSAHYPSPLWHLQVTKQCVGARPGWT